MSSRATAKKPEQSAGSGPALTDEDRTIIESAKRGLGYGVDLRTWWEEVDKADSYTDRYTETFVFRRPDDTSFGFFEEAQIRTGKIPVIGDVQKMRFDRPKTGTSAEEMRKQVREYVLKYFMRVSDFREPQPVPETGKPELPAFLKPLSRCPSGEYKKQGFGYSQMYYRLRDSGQEGRFSTQEQDAIIDLRRLEDEYEWIIVRNPIVDFGFNFAPLGVNGPQIKIPIPAANHLILSRDTVTFDENPGGGLIGRYGIGYAFVRDPGKPGMFAYGPGQLEPALELLTWEVRESGAVDVKMTFVSSSPEALINVSVNPLQWGLGIADLVSFGTSSRLLGGVQEMVDRLPFSDARINPIVPSVNMLNLMTGNAADKYFCMSKRQLEKELLHIHFMQHYNAVLGSLQTWRQFADWTDADTLPAWVKSGVSA